VIGHASGGGDSGTQAASVVAKIKFLDECRNMMLASDWPLMVVAAAVIEAALRHATLASRYTAISAL
jgi:hypothetical protein